MSTTRADLTEPQKKLIDRAAEESDGRIVLWTGAETRVAKRLVAMGFGELGSCFGVNAAGRLLAEVDGEEAIADIIARCGESGVQLSDAEMEAGGFSGVDPACAVCQERACILCGHNRSESCTHNTDERHGWNKP